MLLASIKLLLLLHSNQSYSRIWPGEHSQRDNGRGLWFIKSYDINIVYCLLLMTKHNQSQIAHFSITFLPMPTWACRTETSLWILPDICCYCHLLLSSTGTDCSLTRQVSNHSFQEFWHLPCTPSFFHTSWFLLNSFLQEFVHWDPEHMSPDNQDFSISHSQWSFFRWLISQKSFQSNAFDSSYTLNNLLSAWHFGQCQAPTTDKSIPRLHLSNAHWLLFMSGTWLPSWGCRSPLNCLKHIILHFHMDFWL